MADVENQADGQHRELDALKQAQRAGEFMQHELGSEGGREHCRNGVEAEGIERDGERPRHAGLRTKA